MRLCDLEVDLDKWYRVKDITDQVRVVKKYDISILLESKTGIPYYATCADTKKWNNSVTLVEPEPECLYECMDNAGRVMFMSPISQGIRGTDNYKRIPNGRKMHPTTKGITHENGYNELL